MSFSPRVYKTISVQCHLPPEILRMLGDFRDMVNQFISWGIYTRVHGSWDMIRANRDWFKQAFGGRYASHYLNSASYVASELLHGWLLRGGDTSKRPYVKSAFVRLDRMLLKLDRLAGNKVQLRITLAPRQYVYISASIHHKRWRRDSQGTLVQATLVPSRLGLVFQLPDHRIDSPHSAGVDLNFERAVIATDCGRIMELDVSGAMGIQERHRRRRERISRRIPKNLRKQHLLLGRDFRRERRRVEGCLYGYRRELLALAGNHRLIFEDLSTTTQQCLRDTPGRRARARLSAWAHGRLQGMCLDASSYRSRKVFARGTSSCCPFW